MNDEHNFALIRMHLDELHEVEQDIISPEMCRRMTMDNVTGMICATRFRFHPDETIHRIESLLTDSLTRAKKYLLDGYYTSDEMVMITHLNWKDHV